MPQSLLLAQWLVSAVLLTGGCTPQPGSMDDVGTAPVPSTSTAPPVHGVDEGAGPDDDAPSFKPGRFQGSWRVVARDDRADAALMVASVQMSEEEIEGSGDYVLFQPFCDAVDGRPITGTADCELIGQGGFFDRVRIQDGRLLLQFSPTADGAPHHLELEAGESGVLEGRYVSDGGRVRLDVVAAPPPGTTDQPVRAHH